MYFIRNIKTGMYVKDVTRCVVVTRYPNVYTVHVYYTADIMEAKGYDTMDDAMSDYFYCDPPYDRTVVNDHEVIQIDGDNFGNSATNTHPS